MKTKYKFINFKHIATNYWSCANNRSGAILGKINWYEPWRCYVYLPDMMASAAYNATCLEDISHFLKQLNGCARTPSRPQMGMRS